ncbi:retinol dehydrogenase 13 [Tribolium castaneum]|uniref:WW domain-containing oxidoreductase-like Protein n=1 Tax=Tribolium castaneum TaxID=7070 RepID=D6W7S0_TRICA|nr:PREDICTED: retinol dehydrogenase 13 [Tribolium castaneum]EFA11339.1 WW domain-containing oxidoreductase-like Protein [Tribolium castaneum]|eukprot:XP_008199442.1 PREDICTED: retinol dehydrogenase 13 [Tribolium castaneum]
MGLFSGKCVSKARLDGKTAVVTGANTGIGKETVKDFFQRGARVIVACRNLDKANQAVEDIKKEFSDGENLGELMVTQLDLTSLKSVRNCAKVILETEKRIDLLINNAGVMMCPEGRTEDGFEMQFGTNHLGHFLLTLLLLPKICQSTPARIVNVSSVAHKYGCIDFEDLNWQKRKYSSLGAYQQSKLANILFTKELVRRLAEANVTGVNVYSLHPGVIRTELGRHLDYRLRWLWRIFSFLIKTPDQGAQTTIYCAVDEKCANETGLYYADCAVAAVAPAAQNSVDAKRLWDESLKLVGLEPNYNPFTTV